MSQEFNILIIVIKILYSHHRWTQHFKFIQRFIFQCQVFESVVCGFSWSICGLTFPCVKCIGDWSEVLEKDLEINEMCIFISNMWHSVIESNPGSVVRIDRIFASAFMPTVRVYHPYVHFSAGLSVWFESRSRLTTWRIQWLMLVTHEDFSKWTYVSVRYLGWLLC